MAYYGKLWCIYIYVYIYIYNLSIHGIHQHMELTNILVFGDKLVTNLVSKIKDTICFHGILATNIWN